MCKYRKKASAVAKAGDANSVLATEKAKTPTLEIIYAYLEHRCMKHSLTVYGRRGARAAQIRKY